MWTLFWDMRSGGSQKEEWSKIYIEAPEAEAIIIFYNKFGHNPNRVSCTCCGNDYSINENESLEQESAFHRGCAYVYFNTRGKEVPRNMARIPGKGMKRGYTSRYVERQEEEFCLNKYQTLEEYIKNPDVLVIYKKDIEPKERIGDVPE